MRDAARTILCMTLATIVIAAGPACHPRGEVDDRIDSSSRTVPTTITADHHPPPRMPEN